MWDRIIIIAVAFALDLVIGDPEWLWHPIRFVGWLIQAVENILFRVFRLRDDAELDRRKKLIAGAVLTASVTLICVLSTIAILTAAYKLHTVLGYTLECLLCSRMLAIKSLKQESMKVYEGLRCHDTEAARKSVAMIVGRDTDSLTDEQIAKATVETVAENTSDGEVAPLFYMFIFGMAGLIFYKAVNTLDSMVGYKNARYKYFGRVSARLDDVLNFIPSRIAGILMVASAYILRMNGKNAWRCFKRDRGKHASPNSAQTESACAGALEVQLAGDAFYFGRLYKKPFIGDPIRSIEAKDIVGANRLALTTSFFSLAIGELVLMFF